MPAEIRAVRLLAVPSSRVLPLLIVLTFSATLSTSVAFADPRFEAGPAPYEFGHDITSVGIADLNRDGKPDLAAVTGTTASVLLGNGDGTFGAQADFPVQGPNSYAVADLNGDGIPDIATATKCSY